MAADEGPLEEEEAPDAFFRRTFFLVVAVLLGSLDDLDLEVPPDATAAAAAAAAAGLAVVLLTVGVDLPDIVLSLILSISLIALRYY